MITHFPSAWFHLTRMGISWPNFFRLSLRRASDSSEKLFRGWSGSGVILSISIDPRARARIRPTMWPSVRGESPPGSSCDTLGAERPPRLCEIFDPNLSRIFSAAPVISCLPPPRDLETALLLEGQQREP